MIVKSPPLGQVGVVPDLGTAHRAPVGAWLEAANVRFDDGHIRPILEPTTVIDTVDTATWFELYDDDIGSRIVYGSADSLYRLNIDGTAWEDVTRLSGPYNSGNWHSFVWGDSVVFNNGIDAPQILTPGAANFIDLPNWGLLTSGQKAVSAKSLRPFGNFMVALNITIDGVVKPNQVWWSDAAVLDNNDANFNQPSWDYESPTNLSGFTYVGVSDGELVDSLTLDTSHMIYLKTATFAMQLIGGQFVFAFRRVLEYGLAQLGAVAEYNNFHYVIDPATVYIHDGSTVRQVANARVEETFLSALKEFSDLRCEHNIGDKEIHTLYVDKSDDRRKLLIYNYEEDNFTFADAWFDDPAVGAVSLAYGLKVDPGGGTWEANTDTWETIQGTWGDLDPSSDARVMYWLLPDKLMLAEQSTTREPTKRYFARSGRWAFSDFSPEFDSNNTNEFSRILPHIEGEALTRFTISTAENLGSAVKVADTGDYDPESGYKVDIRANGRYIIMDVDIIGDGAWEFFSMEMDVEAEYGR